MTVKLPAGKYRFKWRVRGTNAPCLVAWLGEIADEARDGNASSVTHDYYELKDLLDDDNAKAFYICFRCGSPPGTGCRKKKLGRYHATRAYDAEVMSDNLSVLENVLAIVERDRRGEAYPRYETAALDAVETLCRKYARLARRLQYPPTTRRILYDGRDMPEMSDKQKVNT